MKSFLADSVNLMKKLLEMCVRMNAQFQAKLGHMTTSMAIMHDIYLCKQFHRRIIDKKNPVINESNSFNLKLLSNNSISQLKQSYGLHS